PRRTARGGRAASGGIEGRPPREPGGMGGVRGASALMRVAFIAPLPFTTLSGGYAYDRRMIAGLRAAGHTVDAIELAGDHPLTNAEARNAAARAWTAFAEDARPVIDGLALPAFDELAEQLVARGAVGLIHHPTALETGFTEEQRETLRAAERRLMPMLSRVIVTSEPT